MSNRLAGILAIFAFATVCLFGAIEGQSINTVLGRALAALFFFYLLGLAVGAVAKRVIVEYFDHQLEQPEEAEPAF